MSKFRSTLIAAVLGLGILGAGIPAALAAGPVITGFSPVGSKVGAAVTINGSGFTGASSVTFDGTAASFTVSSDIAISTKVPNGALTGPVTVTVGSATAVSPTDYKVVPNPASFVPASGSPGSTVAVYGSAFTAATAVTFNGTPAVFHVISYAEVDATVPSGATTGKIAVTTPGGTGTSVSNFTVVGTSVTATPGSGPPTKPTVASGSGFQPFERVDVFFDSTLEAVASADGGGAFSGRAFRIPADAVPGTHWVTGVGVGSGRSAQTPFTVSSDWSQYGYGDRHKRLNPYENVLSTSNIGGLDEDWSTPTGNFGWSSPAVSNGFIYLGSGDAKVYALNAATGAVVWTTTTGGGISSPAVVAGTVYVGSLDHKVYALNAATGAVQWIFTTGDSVSSSPAVANGIVYIGSYDHKIYALNASTGVPVWAYTTGSFVLSAPAVSGGRVYVGSGDGKIYALNAATGVLAWSYTTGGGVISSPAVASGTVYVGSDDAKVYALNAATGSLAWSYTTAGVIESSPAVANGVVYVGSDDQYLYALNASTGGLVWSAGLGSAVQSAPAVANGVVYAASAGGTVTAFDDKGDGLWSYPTGSPIYSSPAVANGVVSIVTYDGTTWAFGLDSPPVSPARPDPATLIRTNGIHP